MPWRGELQNRDAPQLRERVGAYAEQRKRIATSGPKGRKMPEAYTQSV